jgi:hypothetical protein
MIRKFLKPALTGGLCVFLSGMISCDLNKIDFSANDSDNVKNETVTNSYFEDATDISSTVVSAPADTEGGRKIITIATDNRFSCAIISLDISDSSTLKVPKGLITIDFQTGCTDSRGNIRKGKILIAYSGRRFRPGSTIVTTFDGYSINGVAMEGKHILTNTADSQESDPRFTLNLIDGKLTWPDGTTALRETQHVREWVRTTGGLQDQWLVTGTATGTNRKLDTYSMTITKQLVYDKVCMVTHAKFMPAEGKEELVVNSKKIDLDFGNGSCDQKVDISINGKSTRVDLSGNN